MSSTSKIENPAFEETAAPKPNPYGPLQFQRRIHRDIYRNQGISQYSSPYALFEDMESKDAHLFSILQTRKLGVLSRTMRIEAVSESEEDQKIAQWVAYVIHSMPGWHPFLNHLLDCLSKGFAVTEVVWGIDKQERIVPKAIKARAAERFYFDDKGRLRLFDSYLGSRGKEGMLLPDRKFIIALFGANDERPYGQGLCERTYWYWWFKKHNIKYWLLYNEKFGSPTVIAKHRQGLNEAERNRLLEIIDAIQTDAGITIPEGISVELLETHRGSNGETYKSLAQWCNEEMSRAVLGQTLTVSEGQHSGSLAQARVHESVRNDYVRSDAMMLMDIINSQLIRWLIDINFGEHMIAPKWTIDLTPETNLAHEISIDNQLLQMGVPLPIGYFYSKYGRPAPTEQNPPLSSE